MSTQLQQQVQDLIIKIKSAPSEKSLIDLLRSISIHNDVALSDYQFSFIKDLRVQLSQIDPISIADSSEWNMIQAARVYLHRIMKRMEQEQV